MKRKTIRSGISKLACVLVVTLAATACAQTQHANELTWAIKYDPKTFDPAVVDDQASETVRFLTAGVLLRLNRQTQRVEPALAERWETAADGLLITLHLRHGLRFSDGSALTSADAMFSLQRVLLAATAAPVAEEFGDATKVTVDAPDAFTVRVHLPKRVVSIDKVFDEIAVEPANRPSQARVTSGPFTLGEYRRGESLHLVRNPNYWKRDAAGVQLPYLAGVRLEIVNNPETTELRFERGQYQLLESVTAADFNVLAKKMPNAARDLGPSLNTEQMWFNQAAAAPLPQWEKAWFTNVSFRRAVSLALRRSDMARIAFDGHATPANGFVSPANTVWHNDHLQAIPEDRAAALKQFADAGFHQSGGKLFDNAGHAVTFSLLTNAGNRGREKLAALIEQDLAAVGISVMVVTLDFPALIDRLMHQQNYEAALLGLSNVEPDPSSMENVWLSSSPNHQWNPSEKSPATPWEAELDRLMAVQASAANFADRKRAVDRVQQIVAEQLPFLYLVYPNALYAISSQLDGVVLTTLQPGVVSNIDSIRWKQGASGSRR